MLRKFFLLILATTLTAPMVMAQSVPEDYLAGVINVTNVEVFPNGSRRVYYQMRQSFVGGPKSMSFFAPGSNFGASVPAYDTTKDFLNNNAYTTGSYVAQTTISASSIDPSQPQDQAFGNFGASFRTNNNNNFRAPFLENAGPGLALFNVGTRFNIGTLQGTPPGNYPYAAPNYNGPLIINFVGGSQSEINLAPFITNKSGHGVICQMKQASLAFGLLTNPRAGDHALGVSSDCRIVWNVEDAAVGEVYALQLQIFDAVGGQVEPVNRATTEVDLIVQINCEAGDLSCLQCGERDMASLRQQIVGADTDLVKLVRTARAKTASLSRRRHKMLGAGNILEQRAFVKRAALLKKNRKQVDQLSLSSVGVINTIPSSLSDCLRPSELFCIGTDNSAVKTTYLAQAQTLLKYYNPLVRTMVRVVRMPGDRRARAKGRAVANRWNRRMQTTYGHMQAVWATYPGVLYSCSETPL